MQQLYAIAKVHYRGISCCSATACSHFKLDNSLILLENEKDFLEFRKFIENSSVMSIEIYYSSEMATFKNGIIEKVS